MHSTFLTVSLLLQLPVALLKDPPAALRSKPLDHERVSQLVGVFNKDLLDVAYVVLWDVPNNTFDKKFGKAFDFNVPQWVCTRLTKLTEAGLKEWLGRADEGEMKHTNLYVISGRHSTRAMEVKHTSKSCTYITAAVLCLHIVQDSPHRLFAYYSVLPNPFVCMLFHTPHNFSLHIVLYSPQCSFAYCFILPAT